MSSLKKALTADQEFKRIYRLIKSFNSMEWDDKQKDVKDIHSIRKMRGLHDHKLSPKRLAEANLQEVALRGRLVKIMLDCMSVRFDLQKLLDMAEAHITTNYQAELSRYSTVGARGAVVRDLLKNGYSQMRVIEKTEELAQYVIEDIDKTSYRSRDTMECFELATRPEIQL